MRGFVYRRRMIRSTMAVAGVCLATATLAAEPIPNPCESVPDPDKCTFIPDRQADWYRWFLWHLPPASNDDWSDRNRSKAAAALASAMLDRFDRYNTDPTPTVGEMLVINSYWNTCGRIFKLDKDAASVCYEKLYLQGKSAFQSEDD